jgi:hypothetical protein
MCCLAAPLSLCSFRLREGASRGAAGVLFRDPRGASEQRHSTCLCAWYLRVRVRALCACLVLLYCVLVCRRTGTQRERTANGQQRRSNQQREKKGAPRKKEPLAGWGLPAELKDEQFARSLKGANFMRIKDN